MAFSPVTVWSTLRRTKTCFFPSSLQKCFRWRECVSKSARLTIQQRNFVVTFCEIHFRTVDAKLITFNHMEPLWLLNRRSCFSFRLFTYNWELHFRWNNLVYRATTNVEGKSITRASLREMMNVVFWGLGLSSTLSFYKHDTGSDSFERKEFPRETR